MGNGLFLQQSPITQPKFVRIQESGVRMFEKLVNYQIGIFGVSLKKLIAIRVACR